MAVLGRNALAEEANALPPPLPGEVLRAALQAAQASPPPPPRPVWPLPPLPEPAGAADAAPTALREEDGPGAGTWPLLRQRAAEEAEDGDWKLLVTTANGGGWNPVKQLLTKQGPKSHVYLVQEHKLDEAKIGEAKIWLQSIGWRGLFLPCGRGVEGGPSAGVAILARADIGLEVPRHGGAEVTPHRILAGEVQLPGHPPLVCYSGYFLTGEGVAGRNRALYGALGAHLADQQTETLVGADFQADPAEVQGLGFPGRAGLTILRPGAGEATCVTNRARTTIDWFLASDSLANAVDGITVHQRAPIEVHKPVTLDFQATLNRLQYRVLYRPALLATEKVVGPQPKPPNYSKPARQAQAVVEDVLQGETARARENLHRAYQGFARRAERELVHLAGRAGEVPEGELGRPPRFTWRRALPSVQSKARVH